MDLRQLEYFMAVSKELHFTRAAEKLYISQPSLSQQIKNLEMKIGMPLFDRVGKQTVLTEAGKILLAHSRRVFHEIEQAEAAIRDLNGLQRGNLTVGSLMTCVNYLLPPAILSFKQLYPNIELSILGLRSEAIIQGLLENNFDIGITYLPVKDEEFEYIPLFTEELVLTVSIEHPLASMNEIEMKKLKDVPMILLPQNYFLRQLVDIYFKQLNLSLKPALEMTTLESLIQMVSKEIGVTILPAPYINSLNNKQLATVKLTQPIPERTIGIIYRKDKFMCAATKTFINKLKHMSQSVHKNEA